MQIKSDVVENWATKIVKHWIKNISSNIGAVIFKLGTKRINYKRDKMLPVVPLPWQLSWLQSLSDKNQISPFPILVSATEGLVWNRHASYMVITLLIRLIQCWEWKVLGKDKKWEFQFWLRQDQRQDCCYGTQPHRCHFVSFVMFWCQVWRTLLQFLIQNFTILVTEFTA